MFYSHSPLSCLLCRFGATASRKILVRNNALATHKDKRQFVYNLVTFCLQFVFGFSWVCLNFVTTKRKQNKDKWQIVDNLSFVFVLCYFCLKFDKWQIFFLFLLWQNLDKSRKKPRQIVDKTSPNCRQIVLCLCV